MSRKPRKESIAPEEPESLAPPAAESADSAPAAEPAGGAGHGPALVEPAEGAITRLEAELDRWKDQYARLAADLDNFRKRTQRERSETWSRAQAEVVANVLDSLDDLGRVAHLDPDRTAARDVVAGVELVERKLLKELESAGLVRVGQVGERFDPVSHEAVSTVPAAGPDEDHLVANVFQPGYRFGGALLRPARVQVRIWQGGADAAPAER